MGAGGRRAHGLQPVLLQPLFPDADRPAAGFHHRRVTVAAEDGGGGPALAGRGSGGYRYLDRTAGLVEMLRVDLPEAAGGRLAERTGPVWARPRAGVGPWPGGGGDLEL